MGTLVGHRAAVKLAIPAGPPAGEAATLGWGERRVVWLTSLSLSS